MADAVALALVNGGGTLVSVEAKIAVGYSASVLAINSGYASSESGSCSTWPSLCQICPSWYHRWAF